MILLYHETTTDGMIATPAHVHGQPLAARRYAHEGHFLAIEGNNPEVVNHDADLILKIAGFRLATAQEQNAYRKMHEQAEKLVESEQDHSSEEEAPRPEPLKEATPPRPPRRKGRG